jgi:maltose alpha-D-glucosyltransferase/alpha-amylase
VGGSHSNTSIVYQDRFFFKLYRKVDKGLNPDLELSRFLSRTAKLDSVPRFTGGVELQDGKANIQLGMVQSLTPHQGDAWTYFRDIIDRFFERAVTEKGKTVSAKSQNGKAAADGNAAEAEKLPEKDLEQKVTVLAQSSAEMHIALASHPEVRGFETEPYSLHYQRSIFSSMQSQLRRSFQYLDQAMSKLPDEAQKEAKQVKALQPELVKIMREIVSQ